jgi:transposase
MGRSEREERRARPRAPAADARHLHPHRGRSAPARRLRAGRRQAVRAHQATQDPDPGSWNSAYLRSLYPPATRIAIICDNFSPHLTTAKDSRVGEWAAANNVEIAYTPTNSSWLNRIEAQFTALRYFALDGTDHTTHKEQASMIRRYIIWRNNHAYDERLRQVVDRANVA